MEQITKSVCVCLSVYPSVDTQSLTVAFLIHKSFPAFYVRLYWWTDSITIFSDLLRSSMSFFYF